MPLWLVALMNLMLTIDEGGIVEELHEVRFGIVEGIIDVDSIIISVLLEVHWLMVRIRSVMTFLRGSGW